MKRGGARAGAGRKKGQKNKSTLARAVAMQQVAALVEQVVLTPFAGDAHALLMLIYKDPAHPMAMRMDAAKAAIRFEKPMLAASSPNNGDTTGDPERANVPRETGQDHLEELTRRYAGHSHRNAATRAVQA